MDASWCVAEALWRIALACAYVQLTLGCYRCGTAPPPVKGDNGLPINHGAKHMPHSCLLTVLLEFQDVVWTSMGGQNWFQRMADHDNCAK